MCPQNKVVLKFDDFLCGLLNSKSLTLGTKVKATATVACIWLHCSLRRVHGDTDFILERVACISIRVFRRETVEIIKIPKPNTSYYSCLFHIRNAKKNI